MNIFQEIIKTRLDRKRYKHSVETAKSAKKLAEIYHVDQEKAYLAGLLHDFARNMSRRELLSFAEEHSLLTDPVEVLDPLLLHGPIATYLLNRDFEIEDKEILDAIYYHTTGCRDMTPLMQIVYLADVIEPGRDFEEVEILRKKCNRSLDEGMEFALGITIKELAEKNRAIHPQSIDAWNWLLSKGVKRK